MTGPCRFNSLVVAGRLVNLAAVLLLHRFPPPVCSALYCPATVHAATAFPDRSALSLYTVQAASLI